MRAHKLKRPHSGANAKGLSPFICRAHRGHTRSLAWPYLPTPPFTLPQLRAASALAAADAAHAEMSALLFSVEVASRQQHAPGAARVATQLRELEGLMVPIVRDVCGAGSPGGAAGTCPDGSDADATATLAHVRDRERAYKALLRDARTVAAAARVMMDRQDAGVDLALTWCEAGQRAIVCRRRLWELVHEVQVGARTRACT